MPNEQERKKILKKEGIAIFAEDMRSLNREALAEKLSSRNSGRIVLMKLIKSIIWQVYERIQSGQEPPLFGNIRTFWYRFVKPVLAKISDDEEIKTDPYEIMLRAFNEMIMEQRLFRYADFDFTDEGWEQRRLGTTRPDVLVFAEKTGWIRLLRRWHERWGVSILALGGFPSALTSEYTATHLAPLIGEKTVQLIGIVDFDPSGSLIASSFRGQLEASGLKVSEPRLLIEPKHYKDEELRMFAYPLPQSQKTKLSNWLEETGGIEGEAMGLESESLPIERLEGLLEGLFGA
jgi:hypothetical protein